MCVCPGRDFSTGRDTRKYVTSPTRPAARTNYLLIHRFNSTTQPSSSSSSSGSSSRIYTNTPSGQGNIFCVQYPAVFIVGVKIKLWAGCQLKMLWHPKCHTISQMEGFAYVQRGAAGKKKKIPSCGADEDVWRDYCGAVVTHSNQETLLAGPTQGQVVTHGLQFTIGHQKNAAPPWIFTCSLYIRRVISLGNPICRQGQGFFHLQSWIYLGGGTEKQVSKLHLADSAWYQLSWLLASHSSVTVQRLAFQSE